MIIATLIGLLIAVTTVGWYGFERQREGYVLLVEHIKAERDAAKHEAQVFRRLVLPVYDRAEASGAGSSPVVQPQPETPASPARSSKVEPVAGSQPGQSLLNRRVPWRIRFKSQVAATNTKQKSTDALAAAITTQKLSAQKPENSHA